MPKKIYCDFEFNRIVEPKVNLVCGCTYIPNKNNDGKQKFWLHDSSKSSKAGRAAMISLFDEGDTVMAYSAIAEARSLIALGLNPLDYEWIDLFLEYRMLTNHNDHLQWGKQLVDGKIKHVRKPKPKWERTEEDNATGFKATHSLAEATFKLTGKVRDTKHKTAMRDLIISDPKTFTKQEMEDISNYCLEDVVFLPQMWKRIKEEFQRLRPDVPLAEYIKEAKWRGRYAAHTALMENRGYPIDVQKTKNFSKQVGNIIYDVQREINSLFPDVKPFRWNRPEGRFSENQNAIRSWVEKTQDTKRWQRTDGGQLSLSLEAWEKFFIFKHTYPEDNFGAQMVRYLKMKQSLYGFSAPVKADPKTKKFKKKKNFWDSVGSDGMVRPYMNIYGAQSSRSQPAATGFMFLKPAWMRALVIPPKGYFMAGIDYASQEYFAQALLSRDKDMIAAYISGDPYLYQGKLAGAIPPNGTKETHGEMRNNFKNTTLGIGYLMTKYGLAIKLTADTGRVWTEDEAQEQIDLFYETFPDLKIYQEDIIDGYRDHGFIKLPDGWYMFGDNDNHRSVANVPVQGLGACAMRKAVDLAVAKGVDVRKTLHDALYMFGKVGDEKKIVRLAEAMREGFALQFPEDMRATARKIRLDPFAWSPDYKRDSEMKVEGWKIPTSDLYIDDRSINDFLKFSQYFNDRPEDDL